MNVRNLWWMAAALGMGCGGDGEGSGDGAGGSPWAATLAGTMYGHAAFEDDWEAVPYCEGELDAVIDAAGLLTGDGDCTIAWGPAVGERFEVTVDGGVDDDGDGSATVVFVYAGDERSWDSSQVSGSIGDVLDFEGAAAYHPSTGEDLEGTHRLVLSPVD